MKKALGFIFNANNAVSRMICALLYIFVYDYAFHEFVYKLFFYMGIDYIDMTPLKLLSWAFLSVIPILFYKGIQNLSSFFCIFLYVLVYIPFIHALFTMWNINLLTMYGYGILLCAIFVLLLNIGNQKTLLLSLLSRLNGYKPLLFFSPLFLLQPILVLCTLSISSPNQT